jgi:hypothetical protein
MTQIDCFDVNCTAAVCQEQRAEEKRAAAKRALADHEEQKQKKLYDDLGLNWPPKSKL